jgi:predicted nucleic acid-binding protein
VTRFLLDTNTVIALLNDTTSKPAKRVRLENPTDIATSAVVAHELFYGACKSRRAMQNVAVVDSLQLEVLEFDKEDARRAGEIRASFSAFQGDADRTLRLTDSWASGSARYGPGHAQCAGISAGAQAAASGLAHLAVWLHNPRGRSAKATIRR